MTTAAAKRVKAKRARRPIYGVIERVAVLATGEERLAIIASHPIDRRLMAERGFKRGDEVRLEVKRPRNVKFHRLAHAVGQVMVDNVEGWEHLTAHDAVKRLQRESGVCCEEVEIDIPGMGKLLAKQAESIAFDEMTPERFEQLFKGITDHMDRTYSPDFTADAKAEYLLMVQGEAA
jgi:hypothetical protein